MIAVRSHIRTKTRAELSNVVVHVSRDVYGESLLQQGHTIDTPSTDDLIHNGRQVPGKGLSVTKRKVEHVADDQALGNIIGGKRVLARQVVVVLNAAGSTRLQPGCDRVGVR